MWLNAVAMMRASAVPLFAGTWRFQFPPAMSFAASDSSLSGRVRRRLMTSVPPSITASMATPICTNFCCRSPSACCVGAHALSSTSCASSDPDCAGRNG